MPLSDPIKPAPPPPLTRERAIQAREKYAQGEAVRGILGECEISLAQLYRCLDGQPFGVRGEQMPPIARRRTVIGKRCRASLADPRMLVTRLALICERQLRGIETRFAARTQTSDDCERDLRMLSSLTRVVRDIKALGIAPAAPDAAKEPEQDIDTLRESVARKLEAIVRGQRQDDEPLA